MRFGDYQYTGHRSPRRRDGLYPPHVKNERPVRLTTRVRYWAAQQLDACDETVTSIARTTGFSRTTVHRVFYGVPTDELLVGTVEAVADALGIDPGELFKPTPDEVAGGDAARENDGKAPASD